VIVVLATGVVDGAVGDGVDELPPHAIANAAAATERPRARCIIELRPANRPGSDMRSIPV
jgi:hypothetical protein